MRYVLMIIWFLNLAVALVGCGAEDVVEDVQYPGAPIISIEKTNEPQSDDSFRFRLVHNLEIW